MQSGYIIALHLAAQGSENVRKIKYLMPAVLLLLLLCCACGKGADESVETVDPYEGMVQVESGFGTKMWVQEYEDVPVSDFDETRFVRDGQYVRCTDERFETLRGIDVSEHQKEIDWAAVAGAGVEFAFIRLGYRGYSEGGLFLDGFFQSNIEGALENGIRVGIYFFSQAISVKEAEEEADLLLETLSPYAGSITLPVLYDWETIGTEDARTDGVDGATLTQCALAFCAKVRQAGYDTGVYAYRYLAYFQYELPRLTDYTLWISAVGDAPDFYYRHNIWQYNVEGRIPGIEGDVDLDLLFVCPPETDETGDEAPGETETGGMPGGSPDATEADGGDNDLPDAAGINGAAAGT